MLELIQNRINKIKRFFGVTPKNKWLNYYTNMPKEIKYDDGSLIDAVLLSASMYPNNIAIEYYNTEITYVEFINRIKKCARSLKRIGVNIVKIIEKTIKIFNLDEALDSVKGILEVLILKIIDNSVIRQVTNQAVWK